MINLLSTQKKADIRAARTNTILLRYIAILVLALVFIGGILYISYESLKSSEKSADIQLSLSGHDTTTSSTIYQKNKISALLPAIGQALPGDTTLGSFKVSNTTTITFEIYSKTPLLVNELQDRMSMVNALTISSVSEPASSAVISGYTHKTTVVANLKGGN